jgi:predicted nucleic acid-binding Zn ribbon protein
MRKPRTRNEMIFYVLSILIVISMVLGTIALAATPF